MSELIEADGFVHAVSPLVGEFTLCGDAFDLASDEPGYEWKPSNAKAVTCPQCALIIKGVRHLKTYVRES